MPRGQKSKARAREKRRQGLKDAQAKAAEKEESPACSDQASGDAKPSTSTAGFPQQSQSSALSTTASKGMVHGRSDNGDQGRDAKPSTSIAGFPQQSESSAPSTTSSKGMVHGRSGKGDQGQGEGKNSSGALLSTGSMQMDLLTRKTGMLMEYMLCKYRAQQPMKRGEMLKVINKRFKEQFPEILKKATYRLDVVFGLELKEIQPNGQSYELVSKLNLQDDESRRNELSIPTRGILIPLLSVIYLNNYCASEEDVWHYLNVLGVYDEILKVIFGDIRKPIIEELVRAEYLECRQIPNSDPPSYEFLWGPRAYAETSQIKVMDFLAKVRETMPGVYLSPYEQALVEEEEKAKAEAEAAAKPGTKGKAKGHTKTKLSHRAHK